MGAKRDWLNVDLLGDIIPGCGSVVVERALVISRPLTDHDGRVLFILLICNGGNDGRVLFIVLIGNGGNGGSIVTTGFSMFRCDRIGIVCKRVWVEGRRVSHGSLNDGLLRRRLILLINALSSLVPAYLGKYIYGRVVGFNRGGEYHR